MNLSKLNEDKFLRYNWRSVEFVKLEESPYSVELSGSAYNGILASSTITLEETSDVRVSGTALVKTTATGAANISPRLQVRCNNVAPADYLNNISTEYMADAGDWYITLPYRYKWESLAAGAYVFTLVMAEVLQGALTRVVFYPVMDIEVAKA